MSVVRQGGTSRRHTFAFAWLAARPETLLASSLHTPSELVLGDMPLKGACILIRPCSASFLRLLRAPLARAGLDPPNRIGSLQKAAEWKLPLPFASVDVQSAFDRIRPTLAATAVSERGAHPSHVAALLWEVLPATAVPHLAGVVGDPFHMGRGGRQGAPRTPALWDQYISGCLQACHAAWAARGGPTGRLRRRSRPMGRGGVG